jgi:hypothetical protein
VSYRYRGRPDLDNPLWWLIAALKLMFWVLLLELWLSWAVIALPVAGIAKLAHNDELARSLLRSLTWKLLRARR